MGAHEAHMSRALDLARLGCQVAHPNPMVGAVVVAGGEVVGEGYHRGPGTPHAEAVALEEAGSRAGGGAIYVTLEPCNHEGRTPPCTDQIVRSGITQVYFGASDPDSSVVGGGEAALRSAGIEVHPGLLKEEAVEVDEAYFIHRTSGRPRVTYKAALTLDGCSAAPDGSSQWITAEAARGRVQQMRAESDAIGVGGGTVARDDPQLTCRLADYEGRPPLRVVFDRQGRISPQARVLDDAAPTVVVTSEDGGRSLSGALPDFVEVVVASDGDGSIDFPLALALLGERGVVDLLFEGGATTARNLLNSNVIDRLIIFYGQRALLGNEGIHLFGGPTASSLDRAEDFKVTGAELLGGDLMLHAYPASTSESVRVSLVDRGTGRTVSAGGD